ncbi:MAG: hypothetical protein VSS75_029650 [Candidatus Parabeggiatoa sp.]|nr:hypothetical protein [Candidatus Parabeggiatoa sp.]
MNAQANESGNKKGQSRDEQGGNQEAPSQGQPSPKEQVDGVPQPPPLNDNERQNLDVQWQQRLAGALLTSFAVG